MKKKSVSSCVVPQLCLLCCSTFLALGLLVLGGTSLIGAALRTLVAVVVDDDDDELLLVRCDVPGCSASPIPPLVVVVELCPSARMASTTPI